MEITLYSNLRFIHCKQIKIYIGKGPWANILGKPTKCILVQINMQQQHSLATFGLLWLNRSQNALDVQTKIMLCWFFASFFRPLSQISVGRLSYSVICKFRPFATCHRISSIDYTFSTLKLTHCINNETQKGLQYIHLHGNNLNWNKITILIFLWMPLANVIMWRSIDQLNIFDLYAMHIAREIEHLFHLMKCLCLFYTAWHLTGFRSRPSPHMTYV